MVAENAQDPDKQPEDGNGSTPPAHDGNATPCEIVTTIPREERGAHERHGTAGRGRQRFDLDHVRTLGLMGASRREMASQLRTSIETIDKRLAAVDSKFYAAYEEGRSNLALRLRHRQIQQAMAGDTKMLIWLGMQLMGQKNISSGTVEQKGRIDHKFTFTIKQGADAEGHQHVEMSAQREGIAQDGAIGQARRVAGMSPEEVASATGQATGASVEEGDPDA